MTIINTVQNQICQSIVTLQEIGTNFVPANPTDLLATFSNLPTLISCYNIGKMWFFYQLYSIYNAIDFLLFEIYILLRIKMVKYVLRITVFSVHHSVLKKLKQHKRSVVYTVKNKA